MFCGDASCLPRDHRRDEARVDPRYAKARDQRIPAFRIDGDARCSESHPARGAARKTKGRVTDLSDLEPRSKGLCRGRSRSEPQREHQQRPVSSSQNAANVHQRKIPTSPFTSLNITSANSSAIATCPTLMMYSRVRAVNALPLTPSATLRRI